MSSKFKNYEEELKKAVQTAEKQCGNLTDVVVKHFFGASHKMNLEAQIFCDPALEELKKYEGWLNE